MKPAMPTIIRGDARQLPLPDASVDLIVTSPPYFGLRSYLDGGEHYDGQIGAEATPREFIDALITCTREWMRVLKPTGSVFVNLGDKYAGNPSGPQGKSGARADRQQAATYSDARGRQNRIHQSAPNKSLMLLPERYRIAAVDELGLVARAVIVWEKSNSMPESVTDRVRRSHEDWVHLTKQPQYYAQVDEIREQYRHPDHHQLGKVVRSTVSSDGYLAATGTAYETKRQLADPKTINPLGKIPGSVWEIPTQPLKVPAELGVDHFASFPTAWPRRIIKGWCPADGAVLDPFGGTGTTALVATMLGRRGISIDLSNDYCRLAQWRASDPKERARAAGLDPDAVAKVAPQLPGQFDLFGQSA